MDQQPAVPARGLERAAMEAVWDLGEATGREVMEHVNARGERARAYTTIATTLYRLVEKGDLDRIRRGRADVFRARRARDEWLDERASTAVEELVERYGDAALVHFARRVEGLDEERLAALRSLIDDRP